MTKTYKIWTVVLGAILLVGGAALLAPTAGSRVRAQDAPAQTLTQAELLTVTLLQQIVAQLVELNHNVERLPAPAPMGQ